MSGAGAPKVLSEEQRARLAKLRAWKQKQASAAATSSPAPTPAAAQAPATVSAGAAPAAAPAPSSAAASSITKLLGRGKGATRVRVASRKRPRSASGLSTAKRAAFGSSLGEQGATKAPADLAAVFGSAPEGAAADARAGEDKADDADDLDAYLAALSKQEGVPLRADGAFSSSAATISLEQIKSGEGASDAAAGQHQRGDGGEATGDGAAAPTEGASLVGAVLERDGDGSSAPGAAAGSVGFAASTGGAVSSSSGSSSSGSGGGAGGGAGKRRKDIGTGRVFDGDDDDDAVAASAVMAASTGPSVLELLQERTAKRVAPAVDHTAAGYAPFRKRFLIEAPEIAAMSKAEVEAMRSSIGVQVRGKAPPRPVRTWAQAGLNAAIQAVLSAQGYTEPFAVQRQAIPAIMAGRDVMAVAKTGSGKSLAFLAPLLRHVADQPQLARGESGPVALILAPTRELVTQLYHETRKFAKGLGLNVVPLYGGSNVGTQVSMLRKGAHVVVGTPGRTLDMLGMNGGRAMSLRRCTMLCLDEADRMFDLGFEPQVRAIAARIRPDRQTVMFSATFPKHIQEVARTMVKNPVEIQVGGRNVVSDTIDQFVEVRSEESKFPRLLQLFGEWQERGAVLVFVGSKERADDLLLDLMRVGYHKGMTIHGGKDQEERDEAIAELKRGETDFLIATSIACRGLDVKHLRLVVNYDAPTHLEDYIHRVGRTGRAERKGTAFTFITAEEAQYAHDIRKALLDAGQDVPAELAAMADEHDAAVKAGTARMRRSGFSARGTVTVTEDGALQDDDARLDGALARKRTEHQQGLISTDELIAAEDEIEALRAKAKAEKAAKSAGKHSRKGAKGEGEAAEGAAPGKSAPASSSSSSSSSASSSAAGSSSSSSAAAADAGSSSSSSSSSAAAGAAAASAAAPAAPDAAQALAAARKAAAMLRAKSRAKTMMAAKGACPQAEADAVAAELKVAEEKLAELEAPEEARKAKERVQAALRSISQSKATADEAGLAAAGQDPADESASLDFVINDYPQRARRRVLSKEVATQIAEWYGCAVTTKGVHVAPGRRPPPGKEKLTLVVDGPSMANVRRAQAELRRTLDEVTAEVGVDKDALAYGKFTIDV
ncbi:hypothetical protein FNF27_01318 [Cafeteria roenbergensis]|uniref:RNA helicase n=1 Tax=Cafeteria roenbergensis TaxID=33653 RepID=A0A5A8EIF5_CAFRO|nr:hypothetical protein FNF27_01318 [Cafeteria roenbergensis]|mmetsp:Transcript_19308/g.74032  ORF Transcript_19308/g.74032 Transcript_19308/m.74032 type:complete len:1117 (+) Transcript_19308:71-3421(+)